MMLIKKQDLVRLKGQSLVEVILAIALLATFASSIAAYLGSQLAYLSGGQSTLEAIYLAQEGLEASRSIRDEGWGYLATGTHGLAYQNYVWAFLGTEEIVGKFERQIIVDEINETERSVTSVVSWPGITGDRSIALSTNLSNWRNAGGVTYEYDCLYDGDVTFYIPLTEAASGDFPTYGSSADQVTLNSVNYYSEGYLNVDLNFTIPQGFIDPVLYIDFEDLDLQETQYNLGGNIITFVESFALYDDEDNELAVLDDSYGETGEFTWQSPLSNDLISGGGLTLTAKLMSELHFLSGSGITVSNAEDGMSNIKLCGYSPSEPPILTGDWTNPTTLSSIDLGPGNQATGIDLHNGFLYMSADASSQAKPDFFVINIADKQNPFVAGSINTSIGLNAVDVLGDFAYLANQDTANHIQIANVSDPANPYLVNSYRLSGNISEALSIKATGTMVLVGTDYDSGPEFFIVDVTNPTSLSVLSTLEMSGDVNEIFIKDDFAYLATSKDYQEIKIVDISNPVAPSIVASINLPSSNDAVDVFVNYQDDRMYVSRDYSSYYNSPEILIYDVANPSSPAFLGSLEFVNGVPAIYAADDYLFIGSSYSSEEFQIFDATDPSNITYLVGMNFPQLAIDAALEDNVIYMAIRSNDALRLITSQ